MDGIAQTPARFAGHLANLFLLSPRLVLSKLIRSNDRHKSPHDRFGLVQQVIERDRLVPSTVSIPLGEFLLTYLGQSFTSANDDKTPRTVNSTEALFSFNVVAV